MTFNINSISDPRSYSDKLAHWWSAGSGHRKGLGGVESIRSLTQGTQGAANLALAAGAAPELSGDGLVFTGTNRLSAGGLPTVNLGAAPGAILAFAVAALPGGTAIPAYLYTGGSPTDYIQMRINSAGAVSASLGDSVGVATTPVAGTVAGDGAWHVMHVERQSGNWVASLDGGAYVSVAMNGVSDMGHSGVDNVAVFLGASAGGDFFQGSVSDFFLLDANLAAGELALFYAYLNAKHGTGF